MKKILTILFLFITISTVAQDRKIDSLKKVIESLPDDTSKVRALNELSKEYAFTEPENAINFSSITIRLAKRIGDKKGEAEALKWSGIAYGTKSNSREEMNYYLEALAIYDSLHDKQGIANIHSNIGYIYMAQGNDTKALEYFFSARKIAEEINDLKRVATVLNNIAVVYQHKPNTWEKAKQYYLESLRIARQIDEKPLIGSATTSLAEYFIFNLKPPNLDSALYYAQISALVDKGTYDEMYPLNILGQIYRNRKEYNRSIEYHLLAIKLSNKFESKYDLAFSYIGLGKAYQERNELKLALESYKNAEQAAVDTKANFYIREVYDSIASVYSKLHDYPNAYRYQYLLTGIKDTIYNTDLDKKLQNFQFDFDMAKKEGEIKLQTQEIRRQTLVKNGFVGGFAIVLIFAGIFFSQRNKISKEKKRSDELLLNILPSETAEELKATGKAKTKSFQAVTVLFTDFKNFTQASEKLTPEELVDEINHCYSEFDKIITKHGIEKIKTIGDAYMCAGGLPVSNDTHPFDVVMAGLEMQEFIAKNIIERKSQDKPFFELRLGIHTGPVVAGIVGIKKFAYDIWGDTVNTASRMESSGEIGKVNISGFTFELIKDKFKCTYRGKIAAKNKGEIDMYFVENSI